VPRTAPSSIEGIDQCVHEALRPFLDHAVLGIGAHAVSHHGIGAGLHNHVVLHGDTIRQRFADRPERCEFFFSGSRIAVVNDLHDDGVTDLGHSRQGGSYVEFIGEAGGPLGVELEHVARLIKRPDDIAGEYVAIERV
jgi:hypothetical protein